LSEAKAELKKAKAKARKTLRARLDCMAWSSAQAHNAREMVDRVFGTGKGAGSGPILRAVWARDTLRRFVKESWKIELNKTCRRFALA
jgi:hypothetical protein